MFDFPEYDTLQERKGYHLLFGTVVAVDQEKQSMTVSIPSKGEIPDILINNSVSINGVGFRYCPIPHLSQVILYDQKGILLHIGYVYNARLSDGTSVGLSANTNSNDGKKNNNGNLLLQRNLSIGESSISGFSGSEVYLSNNGSIYIFNASRSSLVLDSDINALLANVPTSYTENDRVVVRSGSVLRKSKGVSNDLEPYYNLAGNVVSDSEISDAVDFSNYSQMSEFSIDVGCTPSEELYAYDGDSIPSCRFHIADIVIDQSGEPIVQDGSFLKVLLESVDGCGRLCIDEVGSIRIIDTTQNKDITSNITFSPGENTRLNIDIDGVNIAAYKNSFSLSNDKVQVLCTSTGDYSIVNSANTSITAAADGSVSVSICAVDDKPVLTITASADGKFSLKNKDGADPVAMILGQTFMDWVKNTLCTHVHPSAMGPTGASSTLTSPPFDASKFLSKTNSNN